MLRIRLQRIGRRNNPSYRIVVIDSRAAAKKGRPVEVVGVYDTIRKVTSIDKDRVVHWISEGAQVSDTMHNILVANNVIEGVKKNVLPKKHPLQKEVSADDTSAETKDESPSEPEISDASETENVDSVQQETSSEKDDHQPPNPSGEG